MSKNMHKNKTGLILANAVPYLIAMMCSLVTLIGTLAFFAWIMVQFSLGSRVCFVFSTAALCAACACGGWVTAKGVQHAALICGMASFCFYAILCSGIAVLQGTFLPTTEIGIRLFLLLICGLCGGVFGLRSAERKRRQHHLKGVK